MLARGAERIFVAGETLALPKEVAIDTNGVALPGAHIVAEAVVADLTIVARFAVSAIRRAVLAKEIIGVK